MSERLFARLNPLISENANLRAPQRRGYELISEFFSTSSSEREVGVVLPVGCGKSGLIVIAPFAIRANRALVVAPGLRIANQLLNDFNPSNPEMFYQKCAVLAGPPYPEPAEIRGQTTNRTDLEEADVVITNIQQLQGADNRWLTSLPQNFFDLILVDEGHHNIAESWEILRRQFPLAKIVNFSATPTRSDGQLMTGTIIYSYAVRDAIQAGYVKRLKAVVLNPATLRYVRADNQEITVSLEEVRRLGQDESDFRRSIVSSTETLNTIVDASIRELYKRREDTTDNRHKIIASALNYAHCIQVTEAFSAKGLRAAYIHSREDSPINDRVLQRLENHDLDVIVQVRMLGEGFDHRYLSVAAVCSVFRSLTPFAQFVGRIMRVIDQNSPVSAQNEGVVVFHAGSNIARRWEDFQNFSQADQEYFDQLLPLEELNFENAREIEIMPDSPRPANPIEIRAQERVALEEIPLIDDPEIQSAISILKRRGVTADQYQELLQPIPATKVATRQAARRALDEQVKNRVGLLLAQRRINPGGRELDRPRLGRTNFVVLKAAIDKKVNELVGAGTNERNELSKTQLDQISDNFDRIVEAAAAEVFNGKT
jgi:superfamily II DNA or RNA helicase